VLRGEPLQGQQGIADGGCAVVHAGNEVAVEIDDHADQNLSGNVTDATLLASAEAPGVAWLVCCSATCVPKPLQILTAALQAR
jgi:hypothetical protein